MKMSLMECVVHCALPAQKQVLADEVTFEQVAEMTVL